MPFNEKGEFIRASASSSRTRPQGRRISAEAEIDLNREGLASIAKGLVALVLLVGLIWFVLAFREWLLISLVLWLISHLRKLLG